MSNFDERSISELMDLTKRHIRNLIQGQGLTKAELKELVKAEMTTLVKDKVHQLVNAFGFEEQVRHTVRSECVRQVSNLIKSTDYYGNTPVISRLVQDEIQKEIKRLLHENFTITLNGEVCKFGENNAR